MNDAELTSLHCKIILRAVAMGEKHIWHMVLRLLVDSACVQEREECKEYYTLKNTCNFWCFQLESYDMTWWRSVQDIIKPCSTCSRMAG